MDAAADGKYLIRTLERSEWEPAINLAWNTFLRFEAPEYSKKGIQSFRDFIEDPRLKRMFLDGKYPAYGAFDKGALVGMLGIRNENHVSLLFVEEEYHKNGIGRMLLQHAFRQARIFGVTEFTVNAAPYAIGFYHKMGFEDINGEVVADGIRFTPMKVILISDLQAR